MDSALRPRDIQARIRAGESPEAVAAAAGVPLERIEAFAAPVLAERDHVSGLARTNPVRRKGETTSHRTLRNAVVDALASSGVDDDDLEWDSWKLADRRWQVSTVWEQAGTVHEARFVYDQMGRFSVADNDDARRLIGDLATDDLALVRATQDPTAAEPQDAHEATELVEDDGDDSAEPNQEDDSEDAFREGDLQEVDGVYDIVPPSRGDLDALYDMLASFDEDSVKIYAGLVHPKEESTPPDAAPPLADEAEGRDSDAGVEAVDAAEAETTPDAGVPDLDVPTAPEAGASAAAPAAEPEQLSLIDDADAAPAPAPQARRPRRKRASVPSWDEIMFGSPAPRPED